MSKTNQATQVAVPLLDLQAQYAPIQDQVLAAIAEVFQSKQFIQGEAVRKLEAEICAYTGAKHAIGVSSGTDALLVSLMALEIGPGDEVITSPFTFFATAGSIARVGATPVFVDIDPKTYNIDVEKIESKITGKTKAIMPVHLFGQMADMDPIMKLANRYKLSVIEDAAQAIGSKQKMESGETRSAGTIGDFGTFSFFPSKNLGACGDGGMVLTNNSDLADRVRCLSNHGSHPKYYHSVVGGNFRLDSMQAAILSCKLPYADSHHEGRQRHAAIYDQELRWVGTPEVDPKNTSIYNQYTIRTPKRAKLEQALQDANIGHAIYYPLPLNKQECFKYLNQAHSCPEAEAAAGEVLSIPVFMELSEEQVSRVISVVNEATR